MNMLWTNTQKKSVRTRFSHSSRFLVGGFGAVAAFAFVMSFLILPSITEAATTLKKPANNLGLVGYWKLGVDGRQGAGEMNTNWDIESGVTTNWAFDAKTNGVRVNETTDVFRGAISAKLTNSTISSIAFWQDGMSTADGELYLISTWAKDIDSPTTPYFSVNLGALREAGTTSGGSFSGIATDRWKHFWSVWEATSTTMDPYIRTGSNASQGSFLIDDFSVQKLQAADSSGQGNHGDLINSVDLATGYKNDSNGAFYFNGSGEGEYITISNASVLGTVSVFSISAWIKTTDAGAGIYCECSSNGDNTRNFLSVTSGGKAGLDQYTPSGGIFSSNATINDNQWHHILYVQDGLNRKFYIDGVLDNEDNSAETFVGTTPTATRIAYRGSNQTGYNYTGYIDEVRTYNRALSASEALGLYNQGKTNIGTKKYLSDISGLTNWYTFDGVDVNTATVTDVVGGNNGVIENGPFVTLGRVGQGMEFNSGTQQVDLDSSIELGNTDWTMSVWVKTSSSGTQNLLSNQSGGPVSNAFRIFSGGNPGYYHYNGAWQSKIGVSDIDDGEWHHIVWVNDGGTNTVSTYVDGTLDLNGVDSTVTNSGPVNRIGRAWDGSGNGLVGVMDDMRIYNRSLSESEVKRIYNATRPSTMNVSKTNRISDGLVSHWTFDGPDVDLSATTAEVRDVSGNGNHGDAIGGASPGIGKIGQGYVFDGVDDYILASSNLGISGDAEFSMCAWIKWTGSSWSSNFPSFMGNNSTGVSNVGLSFTVKAGRPAIDFWDNRWRASSGSTLDLNTWFHICGTKTSGLIGSTSTIYINGSEVSGAVEGSNTTPNITDSPTVVGRLDSTRWFEGVVDDARWYSRALRDDEVLKLYNMGR